MLNLEPKLWIHNIILFYGDQLTQRLTVAGLNVGFVFGDKKKLTICLENLPSGWTNNPSSFLEIIKKTGASVTFDLGHANSSPWVINNQGSNVQFLRSIAPYIINAHVYEIEKIGEKTLQAYHVAPNNLDLLRPLLLELIGTKCDWWVIELKVQDLVDHTLSLLRSFLDKT